MRYLIVGAGFAGATSARLLADAGHEVIVIDSRLHIGGNAYDYVDDHGILIHMYGPHIFHTNSQKVFDFLSRFTDWTHYEHRVLSSVEGKLYPIPINRITLSLLLGRDMSEADAANYFASKRIHFNSPANSEEVVLNSVGAELCEMFFRGYTLKQWGMDLKDLSVGVAARIPTRTNDDTRYFTDVYQFMPREGYTVMFKAMLDHPKIKVELGVDYFDVKTSLKIDHTIYTGPIDKFFNEVYGRLPYRSLRFEYAHHAKCDAWQEVGTINYPNEHAYTRITEMKKLTGQNCSGTSLVTEFSSAEGDPFYPIPRDENQRLFLKYSELAERQSRVSFIGRLAEYRYFNMDQVVASAMVKVRELLTNRN